jgi:hypothetical protein
VVAFAFGLLHGFGFASGLSTVGMPKAEIPLALLAFNVGVELGPLAFVFFNAVDDTGLPRAGVPVAALDGAAAGLRRRLPGGVLDHSAYADDVLMSSQPSSANIAGRPSWSDRMNGRLEKAVLGACISAGFARAFTTFDLHGLAHEVRSALLRMQSRARETKPMHRQMTGAFPFSRLSRNDMRLS